MSPGFYRHAQGLRLSSAGIGTYLGEPSDSKDAAYEESIRAAIEGGVNLIDTASNYRGGRSERVIGRVLKGRSREELVVCTKAGYRLDGPGHSLDPAFLGDCLRGSRESLGVDRVDVFYLHNPETQWDAGNPEPFYRSIKAAFALCEEMASRGWLRFYGVATWDAFRVAEGAVSLHRLMGIARSLAGQKHRFRFVQAPFNLGMLELFNRRNQDGETTLLQAAGELGISVITSATLFQGRLLRAGLPEALRQRFPGCSTDAQRAIQFSRSTPGVAAALIGMSQTAHVAEALALADIPSLPEKDYYAIYER